MQLYRRNVWPHAAFLLLMQFSPVALSSQTAGLPSARPEAGADVSLEEIVVTATFRAAPAIEVPASVTVLSQQVVRDAGQQSLQDVLGLIPNLNWAGDTSRPRYFQLRGIGELEQYQGAPNPSVGFLIDDIDFSGLGSGGTLYDIDQVEVLRGPQATRYGANALAGLKRRTHHRAFRPGRPRGRRLQYEILWRRPLRSRRVPGLGLQGGGPALHHRWLLPQSVFEALRHEPSR